MAFLNMHVAWTVSARASMCGTFGISFDHQGTNSQRAVTSSRVSSRGSTLAIGMP
jgi:hypothetical protein